MKQLEEAMQEINQRGLLAEVAYWNGVWHAKVGSKDQELEDFFVATSLDNPINAIEEAEKYWLKNAQELDG